MEWEAILVLAIGIPVIIFPVALIWFINIGGIMATVKRWRTAEQSDKATSKLTCSVDMDCPTGYVCIDGQCVLQRTQ
jgi:hypothetical protein